MHLTPYRVVATGNESGMIEVVLNAETTANIQKMAGGATAVFSSKPLSNWLMENNRLADQQMAAIKNFMYSMAGYCVATYGEFTLLISCFRPSLELTLGGSVGHW